MILIRATEAFVRLAVYAAVLTIAAATLVGAALWGAVVWAASKLTHREGG